MIIFRMNGHWYRWNIKRLAALICGIALPIVMMMIAKDIAVNLSAYMTTW